MSLRMHTLTPSDSAYPSDNAELKHRGKQEQYNVNVITASSRKPSNECILAHAYVILISMRKFIAYIVDMQLHEANFKVLAY